MEPEYHRGRCRQAPSRDGCERGVDAGRCRESCTFHWTGSRHKRGMAQLQKEKDHQELVSRPTSIGPIAAPRRPAAEAIAVLCPLAEVTACLGTRQATLLNLPLRDGVEIHLAGVHCLLKAEYPLAV